MANIKFSAFTQKVVQTNVDFLVGYTGADNVRITPAALGDGIYLPLGGGTMVGNIILNDNVQLKFGTSGAESFIYSDGSDTWFQGNSGNIWFYQGADDKDIKFYCDDGAGGVTEYFRLDGSVELNRFYKNVKLDDNVVLQIGSSADLQIKHDATDSFIENITGDLYITNKVDDKDIIFQSDNGSGAVSQYFRLDGSWADGTNVFTAWPDNSVIALGDAADLKIYHDASNSYIDDTGTGILNIRSSSSIKLRTMLNEDYLIATEGGSVDLYYDNIKKLESTATGIQVTDEVSIGTSLVHTGDTDTKVSFGTDEIVLTTAGTDAVTVDSSGDVGIGESSPDRKLHVNSGADNANTIFESTDTAVTVRFTDSTGSAELECRNDWRFSNNAGVDEQMRIDSAGLVGIGTAAPTAALQVVGLVEYADNAAALVGGLTAGAFYRTGDLLKVVH